MTKKEKFELLVKTHGFANISQFAKEAGIADSNIYSNLDNGRWNISIKRMFQMAKVLHCHIDEVISIFYPEEYLENMEIVDQVRDEKMQEILSSD